MTKSPPLGFTEPNFCAVVNPDSPNPKGETRRLFTVPNLSQEDVNEFKSIYQDGGGNWILWGDDSPSHAEFTKKAYPNGEGIKSKYQVGDRPYLMEPTQVLNIIPVDSINIEECDVAYFWGKKNTSFEGITDRKWIEITDEDSLKICNRTTGIYSKQNHRFMLKSFARYSVEITEVRVERLLDITAEGAIREGIEYINMSNGKFFLDYGTGKYTQMNPINSYLSEIAAIHKPSKNKLGGWDLVRSNPWVWVYSFKRIKKHV